MPASDEPTSAASRSAFDRNYWLSRSEGFRVEVKGRRVGIVETPLFSSRADRPDTLLVRAGLFGRTLSSVSVEEVAEIEPRRKRIVLRAAPRKKRRQRGHLRL